MGLRPLSLIRQKNSTSRAGRDGQEAVFFRSSSKKNFRGSPEDSPLTKKSTKDPLKRRKDPPGVPWQATYK